MKIAVTGATGQLGKIVIDLLLKETPASNIIALVRDLNKAERLNHQGVEVRHFDYNQPESLASALKNIDKLLFISANEIGHRIQQHRAVIDAAKLAQVPYIAYTSLLHADTSPLGLAQEHRATEALIIESGISYTFLRNNWYTENYLASLAHTIESGILYGTAADGKISSASRIDYAQAAVQVLLNNGHDNQIYELANSQAFTLTDLASSISHITGREVKYQNLEADQYQNALLQAGLPPVLVDVIIDADLHTRQGALYSKSSDLENLIGRAATSLERTIRTQLA